MGRLCVQQVQGKTCDLDPLWGKGEACTQREVGVQFWEKNVGTFQSFNEQQWKNVMSALLSKIWHILLFFMKVQTFMTNTLNQ